MRVLIKQARIIDPASSYHNSIQDILVESGIITKIGSINDHAETVIDVDDLYVSPGWVDIFANFADPGFEHKETLQSGAAAAAAGGFTDVFVIPNTNPVTDNKSQVQYLQRKSDFLPANIHPLGAVSKSAEGRELAEMYDMKHSGAIAFTDGTNPVQSAGLLLKALQYVKAFNGVIIQIPDDKSIGTHGLMHEGIVSTRLGLAGKPIVAEELLVARDIKLAHYAESRLHFTGITSPKSLEYIRRAKSSGLQVTCSATPYHLFFVDADLHDYDTNLKVYPPIRSEKQRSALQEAVVDGTIDCIATHHMPQEYDSKVLEFEYAKNGMTGIETCYSVLKTILPLVPESRWVEVLSINPRKIFSMERPLIKENEPACLTVFSPHGKKFYDRNTFRSRSSNTPFMQKELQGRVIGTLLHDKLSLT